MITAIIIDDEQAPREVLVDLLGNFCPEIQIVGEANNADVADELVRELKPDLVFLDIEMPIRSGLQFLQDLPSVDFEVIFTTAYDKYAVQAIKLSALDYLVKPIDIKELIKAVHKVTVGSQQKQQLNNLIENNQKTSNKIALAHSKGVDFVDVENILYAEANGSYTEFFLKNDTKILVSKPLREYEEILEPFHFYRCHKSFLVNLNHVVKYNREGLLELKNGGSLQAAKSKREEIIRLITKS